MVKDEEEMQCSSFSSRRKRERINVYFILEAEGNKVVTYIFCFYLVSARRRKQVKKGQQEQAKTVAFHSYTERKEEK